MLTSIKSIVECPGILPHMMCLGVVWSLNKIFETISNNLCVETVYTLSSITISFDREIYKLVAVGKACEKDYIVYEIPSKSKWVKVSSRVALIKPSDLCELIKGINVSDLSKYGKKLIKDNPECTSGKPAKCFTHIGSNLEYSVTYLSLTVKCSGESIEIRSLNMFEEIFNNMRNPVVKLIYNQGRRLRLDKGFIEEIVNEYDKNLLIFLGNMFMRRQLMIPDFKTVNELVDYVKSHFKW